MSKKICAVDIKRLWHGDILSGASAYTAGTLAPQIKAWLASAKEIKNVHQDTWSLEEDEPSQDSFKNQLTGRVYRKGRKESGDVKINFTIGQYDYELKQEFLGGEVITDKDKNAVGWHRPVESVEISKAFLALTIDDQYCFFPCSSVIGSEKDADKAIGIGVIATAVEHPDNSELPLQCWYDKSAIDSATTA